MRRSWVLIVSALIACGPQVREEAHPVVDSRRLRASNPEAPSHTPSPSPVTGSASDDTPPAANSQADESVRMPAGGTLTTRPQPSTWSLDVGRPFELIMGVGSGRDGLDIIALGTEGNVTTYRPRWAGVNARGGTFALAATDLDEVRGLLRAAEVSTLAQSYSSGAWDGAQQILYVAQDGHEQITYCDNAFPARFERLRDGLRALVGRKPIGRPRTQLSDWQTANQHLWDTLTRLRPN